MEPVGSQTRPVKQISHTIHTVSQHAIDQLFKTGSSFIRLGIRCDLELGLEGYSKVVAARVLQIGLNRHTGRHVGPGSYRAVTEPTGALTRIAMSSAADLPSIPDPPHHRFESPNARRCQRSLFILVRCSLDIDPFS